jgi:peptidoglycan hydrolase CwlO-like protein
MKKAVVLLLTIVLLGGALSGCANIQDDATRTKTEGALTGAGVGAVVGAGIGALIGGRSGALLGAGIGAAVGSAAGLAVGAHIADKKAQYASEEAWLDDCLAHAKKSNEEAKAYNTKLTAEIKNLDKQTAKLKKQYEAKKVEQTELLAENEKIKAKIEESGKLIAAVTTEIDNQTRVRIDAATNNKQDYVKSLDAEIAALRKQKQQLEESNKRLTAMSSRISV